MTFQYSIHLDSRPINCNERSASEEVYAYSVTQEIVSLYMETQGSLPYPQELSIGHVLNQQVHTSCFHKNVLILA
jgi:hypothetical protein